MIPSVDRRRVRQSFDRVAGRYAGNDFLAREVDRRMQERLAVVRLQPELIVDLGCSRGGSFAGLQQRFPDARLAGIDASAAMLQSARKEEARWRRWFAPAGRRPMRIVADAARLPLVKGAAGLVWSNLLLHWVDEPLAVLAEVQRTLAVGGLLMFSTLGPDTLKELRAAFADTHAHTQRFADMHDLGDMLVECGFVDPVMDMETLTLTYDSLAALMAELRAGGSTCALSNRRRALLGRGEWMAVQERYGRMAQSGRLPATFEIVYGHAWKAEPRCIADGREIVRFAPRKGA